jgi:hypothetical protein
MTTKPHKFDELGLIGDIVDEAAVYLYLHELIHPMPLHQVNKSKKPLSNAPKPVFPEEYYAIFIAQKPLKSKKDLVPPHSVKLWSTMEMADSCGNEKRIAIDTIAMIATLLTFSGNEVFVNDELFSPDKIKSKKVDL